MTETVQQQIDFIETKVKEVLKLIDILKRTYCNEELPQVITNDIELKKLFEDNADVCLNHSNALVGIKNYELTDLHHIRR